MASSTTTRYVSVASDIPMNRPIFTDPLFSSTMMDSIAMSNTNSLTSGAVPVKFANNLFSVLIKDQIHHLLNTPQIKELKYTEEEAARAITHELTEILKRIVAQHTKDNYKVVIQVMTYPKQDERNLVIVNRCLWNHRTDDLLSIETETDQFKFLIVIHGLAG